jgi:hypothetical protein
VKEFLSPYTVMTSSSNVILSSTAGDIILSMRRRYGVERFLFLDGGFEGI